MKDLGKQEEQEKEQEEQDRKTRKKMLLNCFTPTSEQTTGNKATGTS